MAQEQAPDMNAWLREQRTTTSAEWAARLFGEQAPAPDDDAETQTTETEELAT